MDNRNKGIVYGLIAVTGFGLTLPMTSLLVAHVGPIFAGLGRVGSAGAVAIVLLLMTRTKFPQKDEILLLSLVAAGVVFGFPLLSSFAMMELKASNAGVVVAFLPLITALSAALLFGERHSILFWCCSAMGVVVVALFSVTKSGAVNGFGMADFYLFVGVVLGGIGYAAGGGLTRTMKGWQVICWALAFSFPVTAPMAFYKLPDQFWTMPWQGYGAFLYVTLISQLVGFFIWYKGMSLGGIARVSQTQLLQPFITFTAAVLMLGETVSQEAIFFCVMVIIIVAISKKEPAYAGGSGHTELPVRLFLCSSNHGASRRGSSLAGLVADAPNSNIKRCHHEEL
jgi:drug/metabolite transporter (DMT)-like permease